MNLEKPLLSLLNSKSQKAMLCPFSQALNKSLPFYLGTLKGYEIFKTDETPSVRSFFCLLSMINHVIYNNHKKLETCIFSFEISSCHPFPEVKKKEYLTEND